MKISGMTLPSFLVATCLSLVIICLALKVYVQLNDLYQTQRAQTQMTINALQSQRILQLALWRAGYIGCVKWDRHDVFLHSDTQHVSEPITVSQHQLTVRYVSFPMAKVKTHRSAANELEISSYYHLKNGLAVLSDCRGAYLVTVRQTGHHVKLKHDLILTDLTHFQLGHLNVDKYFITQSKKGRGQYSSLYVKHNNGSPDELITGVDSMTITRNNNTHNFAFTLKFSPLTTVNTKARITSTWNFHINQPVHL